MDFGAARDEGRRLNRKPAKTPGVRAEAVPGGAGIGGEEDQQREPETPTLRGGGLSPDPTSPSIWERHSIPVLASGTQALSSRLAKWRENLDNARETHLFPTTTNPSSTYGAPPGSQLLGKLEKEKGEARKGRGAQTITWTGCVKGKGWRSSCRGRW